MNNESSAFELAVAHVLDHEGGYVDHPNDPGGATNYGISQRSYPALDIEHLTRDQAVAIYRRDYWDRCRCGELPGPVGYVLFDAAVNHGARTAIRLLQQAGGVRADGVIGPVTLAAIGRADTGTLLTELLTRRAMLYADIVRKRPASRAFLRGWMRRLFDVHQHAVA